MNEGAGLPVSDGDTKAARHGGMDNVIATTIILPRATVAKKTPEHERRGLKEPEPRCGTCGAHLAK